MLNTISGRACVFLLLRAHAKSLSFCVAFFLLGAVVGVLYFMQYMMRALVGVGNFGLDLKFYWTDLICLSGVFFFCAAKCQDTHAQLRNTIFYTSLQVFVVEKRGGGGRLLMVTNKFSVHALSAPKLDR